MGTSPEQLQDMVKRFKWAKDWKDKGWFNWEQPQRKVTLLPLASDRRKPRSAAEWVTL